MEGVPVDEVERAVLGIDLEAPGKIRRLPEELLVPPVPEAPDALRDEQCRRDAVRELRDRRAGAMRDDRSDETPETDPAPDAEPALPDRKRPPPLVRQLVPARDDVVEAGADDPRRDAPDGDAKDEIPVAAPPRPAKPGYRDRCRDRDEERQTVEVDRQRTDLDRARARRRYRQKW